MHAHMHTHTHTHMHTHTELVTTLRFTLNSLWFVQHYTLIVMPQECWMTEYRLLLVLDFIRRYTLSCTHNTIFLHMILCM